MRQRKVFGDFQTPPGLARKVVSLLADLIPRPDLVVEPTAGRGAFLEAAIQQWGTDVVYEGYELNAAHVASASERLEPSGASIYQQDFFEHDWDRCLRRPELRNVLVLGNPPWVTNSELGRLRAGNLPVKTNAAGYSGMEARTGKSNFDIAEWMIERLAEALPEQGAVAVLCKTMTARRVLRSLWRTGRGRRDVRLFRFDAKAEFDVSADACLFYLTGVATEERSAQVFETLDLQSGSSRFGYVDDTLVFDMDAYREFSALGGGSSPYRWRSGIKHDATQVMEFVRQGDAYANGLGESVQLEEDFVYPLLKSSDVGNGRTAARKHVLVTQRRTGEDTAKFREAAPRIWEYLNGHASHFDSRASAVYRGQPRFAMFGIGDYSFAPWKVAISGFYDSLRFLLVSPQGGRPVMVDDTCYFLPFDHREEAELVIDLLGSEAARRFLRSLVFPDTKRPVTIDILRRISIDALARHLHRLDDLRKLGGQSVLPFEERARTQAAAVSRG